MKFSLTQITLLLTVYSVDAVLRGQNNANYSLQDNTGLTVERQVNRQLKSGKNSGSKSSGSSKSESKSISSSKSESKSISSSKSESKSSSSSKSESKSNGGSKATSESKSNGGGNDKSKSKSNGGSDDCEDKTKRFDIDINGTTKRKNCEWLADKKIAKQRELCKSFVEFNGDEKKLAKVCKKTCGLVGKGQCSFLSE